MIKIIITALALLFGGQSLAQSQFIIMQDKDGSKSTLIRSYPTYVNARSLAAGVNEDTSLPAGTKLVLFAAACNFYAKAGGTAAVPGDTTDGTASELNPAAWHVASAVTVIGLISPVACVVTVTSYTN